MADTPCSSTAEQTLYSLPPGITADGIVGERKSRLAAGSDQHCSQDKEEEIPEEEEQSDSALIWYDIVAGSSSRTTESTEQRLQWDSAETGRRGGDSESDSDRSFVDPLRLSRREIRRQKLTLWDVLVRKILLSDIQSTHMVTAVVISLVCTVLTSLLHGQSMAVTGRLKQRRAPKPQRLFPVNSPVWDFFDGNNATPNRLLRHTEVLFMMYYAPWDAQSIESKGHFDQLARHFHPSQVRFAAVNCWDPGGACRQMFKLYTHPVFIVYVSIASGVPSTHPLSPPTPPIALLYSGHHLADYMYRFVEGVLGPMVSVNTAQQLETLLVSNAITVVAYFDFSKQRHPPGYLAFYAASLQIMGQDPYGDVVRMALTVDRAFAVAHLGLTRNSDTALFHFANITHRSTFPVGRLYRAKELLAWIQEGISLRRSRRQSEWPPIEWLPVASTVGLKSQQLQELLSESDATAVLLTEGRPMWSDEADFASVAQVALEYHDCHHQNATSAVMNVWRVAAERTRTNQLRRRSRLLQSTSLCRRLRSREQQLQQCCRDVVLTTVSMTPHRNICEVTFPTETKFVWPSSAEYLRAKDVKRWSTTDVPSAAVLLSAGGRSPCRDLVPLVAAPEMVDYCCHSSRLHTKHPGDTVVTTAADYCNRKCDTGKLEFAKDTAQCLQLRLAKIVGYTGVSDNATTEHGETAADALINRPYADASFVGLGCARNDTLRFVALDLRVYGWFIRRFGLTSTTAQNNNTTGSSSSVDRKRSYLVIVENVTESLYVFPPHLEMSPVNVRSFIGNYTKRTLRRHRCSQPQPKEKGKEDGERIVRLTRLTGNTFQRIVFGEGLAKDTVVLYSGGVWCGACQGVLHVILTVAAFFKHFQTHIQFAIIDASKNDVGWEHTVDRYPAIILYPAYRKEESRVYPSDLPLSVVNLLSFLLAHSRPSLRWRIAVASLSASPALLHTNRRRAIDALRTLRRTRARTRATIAGLSSMKLVPEQHDVLSSYLWRHYARQTLRRRILRSFLSILQQMDTFASGGDDSVWRRATFLQWLIRTELH